MAKVYLRGGYACYRCPGCNEVQILPIEGERGWKYDGNADQPTFKPSILNCEIRTEGGALHKPSCHSIITAGVAAFCADSGTTPGQSLPLPDWTDVDHRSVQWPSS